MTQQRENFNTRLGFVFAAAGSAIGLGNIWGFPTNAANNGGGAFLFVYLIVTLLLALPALYAEIYIGNQNQRNPVGALGNACAEKNKNLGRAFGLFGLIGAITMLSFYTIVAGWMLANALSPLAELSQFTHLAAWLNGDSIFRNILFTPLFILLAAFIIHNGVNRGIEKWSKRLMPLLLFMMITLIIYILFQDGAMTGLKKYLIPDFSQVTKPSLIIAAMGQAFFSLSLGVGGMMIYGSYMPKDQGIGKLVLSIAALDTFIAFLAGLLIIPALYVAQQAGQNVFNGEQLIGEGQLIFQVLPTLFYSMGSLGLVVAMIFFSLLSIAALTSTISSTEVPVAYLVEEKSLSRRQATWLTSAVVLCCSTLIIVFFEQLFALVIQILTTFIQPISCLFYFIAVSWLWKKGNKLREHQDNEPTSPQLTQQPKLRLRLLSYYLGIICPILLAIVFYQAL
ncbi:MAG: sodium-dependent transporter [Thalassotalea sp.]